MLKEAAVLTKEVIYDMDRIGIATYTETGKTRGVLLPVGGEIVAQQYGENYLGEFEFFAKQRQEGLLPGNQLRIAGVDYNITGIRDYGKIIVCLLTKAV